ncbi:DUF2894 domain-containing protein [Parapusillimonas sp. JC17]|uniref:DUF2894 domain-containing protein n=1 Tax=Parapusillimonas sp. JC17 TaxID=3445768 RepID=UPI003FA160E8
MSDRNHPETPGADPAHPVKRHSGSLEELLAHIAAQTVSRDAYPELPEMEYFRRAWAKSGTTRLLRHSQKQVPENAGPLNSSNLVHRSLSLMREQSPAYLQHFLAYLDALSWMEQLNWGGAPRKGGRNNGR